MILFARLEGGGSKLTRRGRLAVAGPIFWNSPPLLSGWGQRERGRVRAEAGLYCAFIRPP